MHILGRRGGLIPEHIRHCLNLPVVFPLFFVLGEQLSSEVLSLLPLGCAWEGARCPYSPVGCWHGAGCAKTPFSHSCCTDTLSSLHAGDNPVPVAGRGSACTSHPLRPGTREGHASASNGPNEESGKQGALPSPACLQHHCELHQPALPWLRCQNGEC